MRVAIRPIIYSFYQRGGPYSLILWNRRMEQVRARDMLAAQIEI